MKGSHQSTRFKVGKDLLVPVLVFLIGVAVLAMLACRFVESQERLQQSKAELNAVTYAERMRLDIAQGVSATNTLEEIIVSNDGQIGKFPQIAEDLAPDSVQSIQLAPGGVVTDIYPEEGNEAGKIDLMNDESRGEICRYGRDNDVITMQGPFDLKQGGSGIAVRNPVFLEGDDGQQEFWGFTIVIIRVPDIFAESIQALSDFGYDYELYKTKAPWDDSYVEVYGSGAQLDRAVGFEFEAADTKWLLNVQPKTGWGSSSHGIVLLIACGVLILLLVSGLVSVIKLLRRSRKSESQTAELNRKLQEALDLANAGSVAKTKFISNMSHDIRTPMNAIMGYTTIALKRNQDEKTRECLEQIGESSEHLLALINDVLDISRIESDKMDINLAPVDVRVVVDEVLAVTQGTLAGRELNLEVRREQLSAPYVLADDVRLREVLVNVLSNAIKFTHDGGTIVFAADCEPVQGQRKATAHFIVSDTGIGMSEEFQQHMFEEFSQEHSDARTHYRGTGLGMTIVKRYVEMMGGSVAVESKEGAGTTVSIELPFELADGAPAAEEEVVATAEDVRGLRVLLTEDNDLNAEIARTLLEDCGVKVTRVADGKQAVETFAKAPVGQFDAVLMDVMMPVMNGLEATKEIRALNRPDAKEIPILTMTANAFAEDAKKCLDAGMNAHLAKPLDIQKVIAALAKFCRKG